MLFIEVTLMYTVVLWFSYVMPYWLQRYFVIDIQQLIASLRNNIFQQCLVVASVIYWKLSVGKFVQIYSDLTFLLKVTFFPDTV